MLPPFTFSVLRQTRDWRALVRVGPCTFVSFHPTRAAAYASAWAFLSPNPESTNV